MTKKGSAAKSVLIVDDEEQIRQILKRYLVKAGYEVVGEAGNGEDGIAKASELQPDFILLDNEMPVLNGEEAAGRIHEVARSTRIVAVSGALTSQPAWSDAFLSKSGLAMVGELLDILV